MSIVADVQEKSKLLMITSGVRLLLFARLDDDCRGENAGNEQRNDVSDNRRFRSKESAEKSSEKDGQEDEDSEERSSDENVENKFDSLVGYSFILILFGN